jgi:Rho termination factor, N-terminal domain
VAPGRKTPGPSVKDDETYEALRDEGASKEKAARIANASAQRGRADVGAKGGRSGSYEDWTVDELRSRARELGLSGYSSMRKADLIELLRNH